MVLTEYDASEHIRFATGPGTGIGENILDRCVQKIVEIEDEALWYQLAPYYAGAFVSALWTPDTWFATSITLILGAGALGIAGNIGPWLGTVGIHAPHHGLGYHFEAIFRVGKSKVIKVIIPGKEKFIYWFID